LPGWLFFFFLFVLGRGTAGQKKKLTGCLIITGFRILLFFKFPIITALYGSEGYKTAILVDQPGSFVVLSTLRTSSDYIFNNEIKARQLFLKKIMFHLL
jgi:predicted permease